MRDPIMEYSVKDIAKGARTLGVKWVHQVLAFIIDDQKDNPGEAEKKDEAI